MGGSETMVEVQVTEDETRATNEETGSEGCLRRAAATETEGEIGTVALTGGTVGTAAVTAPAEGTIREIRRNDRETGKSGRGIATKTEIGIEETKEGGIETGETEIMRRVEAMAGGGGVVVVVVTGSQLAVGVGIRSPTEGVLATVDNPAIGTGLMTVVGRESAVEVTSGGVTAETVGGIAGNGEVAPTLTIAIAGEASHAGVKVDRPVTAMMTATTVSLGARAAALTMEGGIAMTAEITGEAPAEVKATDLGMPAAARLGAGLRKRRRR